METTYNEEMQQSGWRYLTPASGTERSPNQSLVPLTTTVNQADHLEIGGCDVVDLVQKFGSPLYILDEQTLRTACRQYRDAFQQYYPGESLVIYASKAWSCLAVCAIASSEGLGMDVVSGGELITALEAGVNPDKIYLHGNNKSRNELEQAIAANCRIIVDNWHELQTLVELAGETPIPILLRLTPGIECHTHEYIRTGHLDSKFGFDPNQIDEVFRFVSQQPALNCLGIHAHIGSQIFELQPHQDLGSVMVQWFTKASQYGLSLKELNIGGGLGIRYTESDDPPSIHAWVEIVATSVKKACEAAGIPFPKLLSEPGRSLIGSACVTAYTIGGQKTIPEIRTYVSIDGGMSDNPRPITYQSLYRAVIANRMSAPHTTPVTIAGKHCESGDVLIKDAPLPESITSGETLVVLATGAYNYSMASNYNRIPRPAAVLVNEGEANLILQRETAQDLLRHDRLPERLRY
ncbi:MAG TPA: diaminopimelate decarboxylase [Leptolyngbyaceae cyanobacterium M33_DOE_097]|uniref:Diaminopimelate decarboxylase n=1 Tax=Oscillatoriales cyanobacterium SpSt-418 TaxID=2282169 RepID=A0A7C3PFX8_9CYAN|nr:diaminopimelate decarboxylase [Leptolyngbyaceae cyanobacterium M33_DOE_097]